MKDKIIFTIIGIIIGSLVVTGIFYIYNKRNQNDDIKDVEINDNNRRQIHRDMQPPQIPGEDGDEYDPANMPRDELPDRPSRRDYTDNIG